MAQPALSQPPVIVPAKREQERSSPGLPVVVRPEPAPADHPRTAFVRGRNHPRAVPWYGIGSFWGHLRHFVASGIATEDVDSRDWMHADEPQRLVDRIVSELGGQPCDSTLTDSLHRDVWLDFIADTGDDSSVSGAIAKLIAAEYELPDPLSPGSFLRAPRGDLLVFGGDTAYPVATASQVQDRLVVPFNRVLMRRRDGKRRVLLGIPGNHDWYDGLDGFARMFRRKLGVVESEQLEQLEPTIDATGETRLEHVVEWAEKFVVRGTISKRKALVLDGYTQVQHASYFILPLTRTIHLFGVDRQLRSVDFRQRRYFSTWREKNPEVTPMIVMHDPVRAFLVPNEIGESTIRSLQLELEESPHLVLSGDMHHYERWTDGASTHVVAGGGGAFLHPAPLAREGLRPAQVEWPGPIASKALLREVPGRILLGKAGIIPHLVMLATFGPASALATWLGGAASSMLLACCAAGLLVGVVFSITAGTRYARMVPVWLGGMLAGLSTGLATAATSLALQISGLNIPLSIPVITTLIGMLLGPLALGFYLTLLTRLGYEHTQAFTTLMHPGYKHFVRMRIRADGTGVDLWTLGLVDPLSHQERPVLVDHFTWSPPPPPPTPSQALARGLAKPADFSGSDLANTKLVQRLRHGRLRG
ncbi:MAG: magnesium transporter [Polyangiaceae bacterium]